MIKFEDVLNIWDEENGVELFTVKQREDINDILNIVEMANSTGLELEGLSNILKVVITEALKHD